MCIIDALKIRKCNVEMQIMHYIDKKVDCTEPIQQKFLDRMIDKCVKESLTIEDTLKSTESALKCIDGNEVGAQAFADKLNKEESEDE